MTLDAERSIKDFGPHPLIVKLAGQTHQYFVCVEKLVLCKCSDMADALHTLIAAYYVFDIAYPKQVHPILLFIQRYLVGIKDDQPIPPSLIRTISALDKY